MTIRRVGLVVALVLCGAIALHAQAAGDATSANQAYGGPPCRSRDLAATLPLGAISDSSPSSGFSAARTTRNGAPVHGPTGDGTVFVNGYRTYLNEVRDRTEADRDTPLWMHDHRGGPNTGMTSTGSAGPRSSILAERSLRNVTSASPARGCR